MAGLAGRHSCSGFRLISYRCTEGLWSSLPPGKLRFPFLVSSFDSRIEVAGVTNNHRISEGNISTLSTTLDLVHVSRFLSDDRTAPFTKTFRPLPQLLANRADSVRTIEFYNAGNLTGIQRRYRRFPVLENTNRPLSSGIPIHINQFTHWDDLQ